MLGMGFNHDAHTANTNVRLGLKTCAFGALALVRMQGNWSENPPRTQRAQEHPPAGRSQPSMHPEGLHDYCTVEGGWRVGLYWKWRGGGYRAGAMKLNRGDGAGLEPTPIVFAGAARKHCTTAKSALCPQQYPFDEQHTFPSCHVETT